MGHANRKWMHEREQPIDKYMEVENRQMDTYKWIHTNGDIKWIHKMDTSKKNAWGRAPDRDIKKQGTHLGP